MANFKNTTGRDLRVGDQIVRAGESLDLDGDELPGSLRLIAKGSEAAAPRRGTGKAADGDETDAGGGGAAPADKAPAKAPAAPSGGKS